MSAKMEIRNIAGKTLEYALFSLGILALLICFSELASAVSYLPLPSSATVDVPTPVGNTAFDKMENLLGPIGLVIRILLGAFAVMFIVISGFSMAISADNEEAVKEQRKSITFAIIGLLMLSIAGPLAQIFDFRRGNLLENSDSLIESAQIFDDTTAIVVTFIKYLLGGLASLMFVVHGARMVGSMGNEETINQSKKGLGVAAGGLVLVLIADLVIRRMFYDAKYNAFQERTVVAINQNIIISQLVAITNFVVSFVGPIMMLGLIAGALLYVASGGNEERTELASKIIKNSVIGIIIIYGAFGLVSTVIVGAF